MAEKRETHEHADKDGHFRRKESVFRDIISTDPSAKFPAEKGRYALYMNYGCPWAHRTVLTRALKGLDDLIQLIPTDFDLTKDGWIFTGRNGSAEKDPLYGFKGLKQLYLKANPEYEGRYTVPCLWDKKNETIVNNESSEIIRMFYSAFDDFLPPEDREANKEGGGFYPENLRKQIDEMNEWVYNTINNGVYKCGFATSQSAYDDAIYPLFQSLDRLESHLASTSGPYLFGTHVTEADIRLFPTLIRFDTAYHTIFQCNLKSIRHDYPHLNHWMKTLYWDDTQVTKHGVFKKTSNFDAYRYGYTRAKMRMVLGGDDGKAAGGFVVPRGPAVDIEPLSDDEEDEGEQLGAGLGKMNVGNGALKEDGKVEAYKDDNRKWKKAARQAEKKAGVPNLHLASS